MKAVDLFCGYGGATEGLLRAGLEVEAAYDFWPVVVEAHRRWHPQVPCEVRDVSTVTPEELRGRVVWASPPCSPYSFLNNGRRGRAHPQHYSMAHLARQVQFAEVAIVENVPALLYSREGREEMREMLAECNRLGIALSIHVIPAAWYGVRQLRRRAILVFHRAWLPVPMVYSQDSLEPAVVAQNKLTRDLRFMHGPAYKRTMSEAAHLQGLPTEHLDGLPRTHQATLIANAISPAMVEGIVRQVCNLPGPVV